MEKLCCPADMLVFLTSKKGKNKKEKQIGKKKPIKTECCFDSFSIYTYIWKKIIFCTIWLWMKKNFCGVILAVLLCVLTKLVFLPSQNIQYSSISTVLTSCNYLLCFDQSDITPERLHTECTFTLSYCTQKDEATLLARTSVISITNSSFWQAWRDRLIMQLDEMYIFFLPKDKCTHDYSLYNHLALPDPHPFSTLPLCHLPINLSIWRGCTSFTSQLRRVETLTWTIWIKSVLFKLENGKSGLSYSALEALVLFVCFGFFFPEVLTWLCICLFVSLKKDLRKENTINCIFKN